MGYTEFLAVAEEKLNNYSERERNYTNKNRYLETQGLAKKQFSNIESAKQRAAAIRWKTFESLDKYLIEFEANFSKAGGKLIWAQDSLEALNEILSVLNKHQITSVVKSKSMTTEEIGLNKTLFENNIECTETDLGEFILQQSGDTPSHMVTPASHQKIGDIHTLYQTKFNFEGEATADNIASFTGDLIKNKFKNSGAVITGANFIVADTGSIAITENEGNAFLGLSFPKVQIVIAGIDKMIPSLTDLDTLFPILATYGTGQHITAYNHLINGPKRNNEKDGPEELYLIILDNGRSDILSQPDQRSAINCIHCGACLNVCPVYNNAGGHAYQSIYYGPIGSVILPHKSKNEEYNYLSNASTICGKCTEVCPVKIDLHKLLLFNRRDFKKTDSSKSEKIMFYFWKKAMMKRDIMNKGGAKTKNFVLSNFFKKSWGQRRTLPGVAPKSFNELWRNMMRDS